MKQIRNRLSRHQDNARQSRSTNENGSTRIGRRSNRSVGLLMLVAILFFLLQLHLRNAYDLMIIDERLVGDDAADAADAADTATVTDPILTQRTLSKDQQDAEASTFTSQTHNNTSSTTTTLAAGDLTNHTTGDDAADTATVTDPISTQRTFSKDQQDAEASTFTSQMHNNTSNTTTTLAAGDLTNHTTHTTHGFQRYDGVVIVTKVLSSSSVQEVSSWLCFISHAYNDKMKYDVVIFTTTPWTHAQIQALQAVAAPANFKVTVALEGPPLEEQLAAMPKEEVRLLRERCGVKSDNQTLTWYHHCTEKGRNGATNLGYSWQAEFRAYHIWNHPAIQPYKYMMWLDTDAYATKEWNVDPMKAMVENDLVVLYSGYPYGRTRNDSNLRDKLIHSYGSSICHISRINGNGKEGWGQGEIVKMKPCNNSVAFQHIAGSHHITNLEVFRKDVHQQFLKNFTGDYRFSRMYDDQVSFISFHFILFRFAVPFYILYTKRFLCMRMCTDGSDNSRGHGTVFEE